MFASWIAKMFAIQLFRTDSELRWRPTLLTGRRDNY